MTALAADFPQDPDLVAAWRRGDELAASQLVRRHAPALGRYVASAGAASADVEDVVQETFIRAFRGLEGWRGDGPFRGWLFRIAGNLLKDGFRHRRGRVDVTLEDHDIVDRADPAGELAADETAERIRIGLQGLPRLQREVFCLRVEQGLEYPEIATALGTTPGAARVHYHHAVRRLKELVA
jgi:RNA polymerase sigma-70 factor, ECF subfamily